MAKLTIRSERDLPRPSFSGKWGNYNLEEIGFVQIIQFIGYELLNLLDNGFRLELYL